MLLAASRYVTCLFCGARTYVVVVAAVRAVVGHVAARAQAVAIVAVLAVIVVVPVVVVVVVVGPPWFWRDAHGEIKDANNTIWDLWCVCQMMRADCQRCRSHRM